MWLKLIPLSFGWISWIVFEFLWFIRANAVSVIVIRFLQLNERHLYTGILVVILSLCKHISAYTLTYGVSLLQSIYRSFLRNIMSVAMLCYRRRRSEIWIIIGSFFLAFRAAVENIKSFHCVEVSSIQIVITWKARFVSMTELNRRTLYLFHNDW